MPDSAHARVDVSPAFAHRPDQAHEPEKLRLRTWLRLLNSTRTIETEIRARLRADFETTLPRFDVLAQLEPHKGGLTMGELSTRLKVTSGNVTGLVDTMEQDGLVARREHRTDRRSTVIVATPKGRRFFLTMAPAHRSWIDEMLGGVSNADLAALGALLDKVKHSTQLSTSE